jgi:hypothetical protein
MNIYHKELQINSSFYIFRAHLENEVVVGIEAFRSVGETYPIDMADDEAIKTFARKGSTDSLDITTDFSEAQRVLEGTIKWDGCSDINFYPDTAGNEHYCGKPVAIELGQVIGESYEFARELMGNSVDENCFYDR